jgi:hypothetical protein
MSAEAASFQYELPDLEAANSFAGLSQPAREALLRSAAGPSAASRLLNSRPNAVSSPEVSRWAEQELGDAIDKWKQYEGMLVRVPNSVDQLIAGNPNYAETVSRLFEAREALYNSGEVNPQGTNLGETMHLALMPWQDLRGGLQRFDTWVARLRDQQQIANSNDYMGESPLSFIKNNKPLYRDPENPARLLTPGAYLEAKIASDGLWGIVLAQTSSQAGIQGKMGQSPNQLTNNGQEHLKVAGYNVDAMGLLEWVSLSLQEDPRELSNQDWSWLLANFVEVDGGPQVAYGNWDGGQVGSNFDHPGSDDGGGRPRLAVM